MNSDKTFKALSTWTNCGDAPLIISGPCSAETPEQLMETAKGLTSSKKVHVLRAGIWKPRTRPNAFEGVGKEALSWLANTGKELQIATATEVATPQHVELAINAGIDILWIGARTSTNPFSVQAIADSVKGCDIPMMVKNPINPDLNLWIGAIERILNAGVTKIAAIHRGFSAYHQQYRNAPMWEIPLNLKVMFPDLPLLNDPSHIAGNRIHLFDVAQKALNLDMDGLMVETHCSPDNAWSDSQQQITPQQFIELLDGLKVRSPHSHSKDYNLKLESLRSQIDRVDHELFEAISNRIQFIQEIAEYKKINEVTIFQKERWKEILDTRHAFGKKMGLSADLMDKILQVLHDESIRIQTENFKK